MPGVNGGKLLVKGTEEVAKRGDILLFYCSTGSRACAGIIQPCALSDGAPAYL